MERTDVEYARQLSRSAARPPARVPGYEQEEFIGRGAFGEVWKAVDSNSGRTVAIKFYSRGGLDWSHMAREVEKLQHLFSDRYVV
ncbi:MAG TPA: serine/threonine protein kinase, partial [Pirellulales bacterium]|nr:serine/threonine protein kinase [Pirellulales bacterium]